MQRVVTTMLTWGALILCGGVILLCVKEITKIVFEGLTTW